MKSEHFLLNGVSFRVRMLKISRICCRDNIFLFDFSISLLFYQLFAFDVSFFIQMYICTFSILTSPKCKAFYPNSYMYKMHWKFNIFIIIIRWHQASFVFNNMFKTLTLYKYTSKVIKYVKNVLKFKWHLLLRWLSTLQLFLLYFKSNTTVRILFWHF